MTSSMQVASESEGPGPSAVPGPRSARPSALPSVADGIQLLGEMEGSGYRRPPALVRRLDGQTLTLTPLLYLTLKGMVQGGDAHSLARALSAATSRQVTPEDVAYLAEEKLRPLGLLVEPDGTQPTTTKMNPLLALRLKFVISDRRVTQRVTAPFAWLFRPGILVAVLALFLAVSWFVLVDKGLASAVHQAFYEPEMIVVLWGLILASAAFHEFGHAAACRYGGATPGAMGAAIYLVWPAFYTDVTDSYRLGRGGRLRVDLGGLYFNAIFTVATMAAWAALRWDALLLVIAAQHLQMVRQLAPFIRADGYHIVADLTGVPDLFAHIKPTLQGLLPRRWRPTHPSPLKRWARVVVALWVLTMVPVLVALIGLAVLLLPRLAATAWDSMGRQWQVAGQYWAQADYLGVGVRVVAAGIVLLPVLGVLYLLARIARRTGRRVWVATEDDPRRRAAALVGGAAVLAAVAWAWWPANQYQPVEASERGSLLDLVQIEDQRVFLPLLERGGVALRPAAATATVTGAPQGAMTLGSATQEVASAVTATDQVGAVRYLAGASTEELKEAAAQQIVRDLWVFPFPPPDRPGEGDNRAEAINTLDDSVLMDLAASWAIVTANELEQRNEAWALASCEDCFTRAVAFQVLLIANDDPEVVVPVNAAVAANYDCTRCTTEAIAVQLVVSLTGVPSQEAQSLIQQSMDRLETLEADMAELTAGQVYYVLQATQAEIVAILEGDGVLPDFAQPDAATATDEDTSTGTGDEQAAPGTTESGETATDAGTSSPETGSASGTTSEPSPSGEATTEPSTATEPTPTAEPTTEPPAEPTAEPTSEPTTEPSPTSDAGTTEPSTSP